MKRHDSRGWRAGFGAMLWLLLLSGAEAAPRPNIIFILTDDLGYGDLGSLFQKSRQAAGDRSEPWHFTPELDTMAAEGVQLRHHYCPAPVCAPSRASLLLGVHQGHANVRNNQFDKALEDNHTLGSVLREAGYATACIGKWGIQGTASTNEPYGWPAHPMNRGFDYYFGYMTHNAGHFHYPKEDAQAVYDVSTDIRSSLDKCYTTDLFAARAKKWIVDQHTADSNRPFFLYLAFDTPHAKLQYPPCPFPAGSGLAGGLQWLGTPGLMINSATGTVDGYVHPDYASATWDDDDSAGTPEVAWPDVYKRHSTSVRRIDDAVGDLLQLLRDLNIDTNTMVVFTSDNGPSAESYLPANYYPWFFNSFGPFDGMKRDCWEGGVRTPTLVRWPGGVAAGGTNDNPSTFWDWMPTFCDLAGVPAPARSDGVSLVPTLTGSGTQKASTVYVEYFYDGATPTYPEFLPAHRGRIRDEMQIIRSGPYVGVRYNVLSHADNFEIYDVTMDPQQGTNLAGQAGFAAVQQAMKDRVLRVRRPNGTAGRPYDAELVPAVATGALTNGVEWLSFTNRFPWVPALDDMPAVGQGTAAAPDLSVGPRDNDIGLLFRGYLNIPADGDYTFMVTADSGALLRLHDATVVDADRGYVGGSEASGAIRLKSGRHPFRLYYARGTNGAPSLSLQWSGPGLAKQAIPASAFLRDGGAAGTPFAADDWSSTPQNTAVTIDVLANDIDDGTPQPLFIQAVRQGAGGVCSITNNRVRYAPNPGFLGTDSFTYDVSDGAASASATVSVDVTFQNGDYWFPFNQVSGWTTTEAGGGRTASLVNFDSATACWTAGRFGRGLQFDGVNDTVSITGFNGITGTAARTCAAWIRTTATNQAPIMGWGPNSAGNKWTFLVQNGTLRLEITGGWVHGSRVVNDGQWHHVACTFANDGTPDATDVRLYVDGTWETVLSSQDPQALNTTASIEAKIGSDVQTRYFPGVIDEARIYARALTAPEIAGLATNLGQSADAWLTRYYGASWPGWSDDTDGDGATTLEEYAGLGQPTVPDRRFLVSLSSSENPPQATYVRRRSGTHEITYQNQASGDLADWSRATVENRVEPNPDNEMAETVHFDAAMTSTNLFFRIRIQFP